MRQYVILGLAAVILACSLVALADSLAVTPPSDSDQLDALERLEIKSLSSGRITVTSSDGTHVLECDALSLDLLENGASKIRARGTVVLQMGERKATAEAMRLQIVGKGSWVLTSDALKVSR